jgi:cytochrome c biogenesis protein CcmG/thiol:disulfide interchange protein DsbE
MFGFAALSVTFLFLGLMLYAMTRDPNALPSLLVGKSAPVSQASWDNRDSFRSDAVIGRGRWVLMNFWNTTCIVCRYEAPELERFYNQVVLTSSESPLFISVNIQDPPKLVESYKRSLALTYPVVLDLDGKMSLDYGVYGTPETFFIDPEGVVRHRVAGEIDGQTALRFIDYLARHKTLTSEEALSAFAKLRAGKI